MLATPQVLEFETFGFVVLRNWFSAEEVTVLKREHAAGLDAAWGRPFDGTARQWALMTSERTPLFASLLEDDRFAGVAEQLYGGDVLGVMTDASRFVGDTFWHPDTVGFDHYGIKFVFYLEPLRADSGALRVVPGSHRQPYHDAFMRFLNARRPEIDEVPSFVFESEPGDVLAFDLRLYHASCHGAPGRPGASLSYFNNPKTDAQLAALREQDRLSRGHTRDLRGPSAVAGGSSLFEPSWLANTAGNARRARCISRLRELGFFDPLELEDRNRLPH
ncbi:Hypothetical protein A7982_05180 [Minicystis rosea]|nr:Hypothetical protein A7982_05180 [Minicystis rosea]